MGLTRLEITQIRNLETMKLHLHPRFNVFHGANGSGKTSILEAVHILGRGVSFRSHALDQVVSHDRAQFALHGRIAPSDMPISVRYDQGEVRYHLNGQILANRLPLTAHLPLLFAGSESHRLLTEGPQHRRRLLDWGVFHVEPTFSLVWRRYQRILKQRNGALRIRCAETAWDADLAHSAEQVTLFRQEYLDRLRPYIEEYVPALINLRELSLQYLCGWRHGSPYQEILGDALERDRAYGYTRYGPHRADLIIRVGRDLAKDGLSRGQQKLLIYALLFAQIALFRQVTKSDCMILADDMTAELDAEHRQRLVDLLVNLEIQACVTTTDTAGIFSTWLPENSVVFHVERGQINTL